MFSTQLHSPDKNIIPKILSPKCSLWALLRNSSSRSHPYLHIGNLPMSRQSTHGDCCNVLRRVFAAPLLDCSRRSQPNLHIGNLLASRQFAHGSCWYSSCGEITQPPLGQRFYATATPPRKWGKLLTDSLSSIPQGNTPTCVGKTEIQSLKKLE